MNTQGEFIHLTQKTNKANIIKKPQVKTRGCSNRKQSQSKFSKILHKYILNQSMYQHY